MSSIYITIYGSIYISPYMVVYITIYDKTYYHEGPTANVRNKRVHRPQQQGNDGSCEGEHVNDTLALCRGI